MKTQTINNQAI